MCRFVLLTVAESRAVVAVPCIAQEGGALLPSDTAREILAALKAGREKAASVHHEGFDAAIDRLARALGDHHDAAARAVLYGEVPR